MNVYVNVSPDQVKNLIEECNQRHKDRITVLAPISKVEVFGPTKARKAHRFKIEVSLPIDGVVGDHAITDFGGFVTLHINRNRIAPEFLENEKDPAGTES